METEDSADDVFTSSNAPVDEAMNQNGSAGSDGRDVPSTSSRRGHQAGYREEEDEEVIAGGSSYLPSHPVPLLPPEAPKVPPIPISISDENYCRGNWGSKLEFLATVICQLTSLSMFSFAYFCYRHGGLIFVIPYIVVLFVFGLPIILMQLSLGQFASTGFLTMWRFSPILKGVSACILFLTVGSVLLLNVVLMETLNYVYVTLSSPSNLPWSSCANVWNTFECKDSIEVTRPNFTFTYNEYPYEGEAFHTSPVEEYYRHVEAGEEFWTLIVCAVVGSCLLLQSTLMGIKMVGKLSICCLMASFVLTVMLLVRSISLPGSYEGLQFLFHPDLLGRLFRLEVWKDAFLYVIYTLTFTTGTNLTLASHNRFHNNCFLDTAILVMVSIFAPLMLAIAIFSYFGFFAHSENIRVDEVVATGLPLLYVVIPETFLNLPSSHLWTLAWFGLIALNLFSSEMGIVIALTSSILDLFGWVHSWRKSVPITLIICLLLGLTTVLGIYVWGMEKIVQTIDFGLLYTPAIVVIILALSLVWIYGANRNFQLLRFGKDIETMVGFFPAFFKVLFTGLWGAVVPGVLALAVLYNILSSLSHGAMNLEVWILFGVSLLILAGGFALGALHEVYRHKHIDTYFTDYFYRASLPLPKWGPALDAHRKYAGYLPSDFSPQPYRLGQGDPLPEEGLQPDLPEAGSTSKDAPNPGAATLPDSTPLLGLTLCSTETTL